MLSILISTSLTLQLTLSDPDGPNPVLSKSLERPSSSPTIELSDSLTTNEQPTNLSNSHAIEPEPTPLKWRNINISLPHNTSHHAVGYHSSADRVYILGGTCTMKHGLSHSNNEYWSLQFNHSFMGWSRNDHTDFSNLQISESQQSFASSSLHNLLYIKTKQFIHIFDMEIEYFTENVIELPTHLSSGCMAVYHDSENTKESVEYLIIVGAQDGKSNVATTWIYRVDQVQHTVTFHDVGPDLFGIRDHHSCAVMGGYLYVIGGVYKDTRFVEQWHIEIVSTENDPIEPVTDEVSEEMNGETDESEGASDGESDGISADPTTDLATDSILESNAESATLTVIPATFSPIDTFVSRDGVMQSLPQYGHRSVVDHEQQRIYVIGGLYGEKGGNPQNLNYSKEVLVLERINDSLYEMNYRENTQEQLEAASEVIEGTQLQYIAAAKLIPTLPRGMAFVGAMMDRYGYLNIFGGEWAPNQTANWWLRVNTANWRLQDGTELDVIWRNRHRFAHNEQWALLILVTMLVCVCCWCKSVNRVREKQKKSNGRGVHDGSAYDEITGSSDIDDLEDTADDDIDADNVEDHDFGDDLVPMKDPLSSDDNEVTTDVDPNDPEQQLMHQHQMEMVPQNGDVGKRVVSMV